MVELDKPVTMANYVFILLSTMMTSIAFNHVILKGIAVKDTDTKEDELTPNETIQNLYNLKIGLETKVSELQSLIEEYNKITGSTDEDEINRLKIKGKIGDKYLEYKTELSAYIAEATGDYKTIFKFKFTEKNGDINHFPLKVVMDAPLMIKHFPDKVDDLYNTFKTSAAGATPPNADGTPNAGGTPNADGTPNAGGTLGGTFTNTSFEGFF